jgi:hypothetical protein
MRNGHSKRIIRDCLLCSLVVITGCCINIGCWPQAKYERTDRLSAALAPGSTVAVRTSFGSISVTGADVNRCDVTAQISVQAPSEEEVKQIAEKVQIRLEPVGETLNVKVDKPHLGSNRCVGVSFDITVPQQTNIDCATSYGAIKLADINGDIEAEASYASIDSKNTKGAAKLETSYGGINCYNITSNELSIRSSYGSIDVTCSDSASAEMAADVVTSYGNIDLKTPPGFTGLVDMSTSYGSIKTEMPITVKGDIGKDHLRGTIGEGKGRLRLKTSFGSIKIR